MADQTAFVEVHHLFVDYPLTNPLLSFLGGSRQTHSALRDISFQLPQGAQITVFGPPTSGKSTLLRTLTGLLQPSRGHVLINGQHPRQIKHIAAGYVSAEESENNKATGHSILHAYAKTHQINQASAKIGEVSDVLGLSGFIHRPASSLSLTQRLHLNLARAAISDSPLILLDDLTDQLGASYVAQLLPTIFSGRTVLIATRLAKAADNLQLPVLLLHQGSLSHQGTIDEIALDTSCPRVVDVWVEGLRYDLLRKLRKHAGVIEARLIPSNQFAGQRLRVTLHSSRYLPALYDLVSQAPLIQVEEIPPSLNDILPRL